MPRTFSFQPIHEANRNDDVWLRKRKILTWISITFAGLFAVDYSGIVISLPYYLKDDVHSSHLKRDYSLITTAMAFSASVAGVVFGRFIDQSRNIRLCLLIFPCIGLIGNVIYTLQYSVWFLLIGRLIAGMIDAAQTTISG